MATGTTTRATIVVSDMAVSKNTNTGRSDAAQPTVMKRIRKPKFVDNAVRHGIYAQTASKRSVAKPKQSDFEPAHQRTYTLKEQDDSVDLVHTQTEQHRYTGAVFHGGGKLEDNSSKPAMLVNSDNNEQRLTVDKVSSVAKGSRLTVPNLKGRSLQSIGFDGQQVHIAQPVGVGMRSSDLAARIGDSQSTSLNSVNVSRKRGSTTFVAKDFNGIDGISAMRFLARHDGHRLVTDRFGNLFYQHQLQTNRHHYLSNTAVTGGKTESETKHLPNRVTVKGRQRSLNDLNIITVDDFGGQEIGVIEVPGGINAPTAVSQASARSIGRKFLAAAGRAKGSTTLHQVVRSTTVQPGDSVRYQTQTDNDTYNVLRATHHLVKRMTDIQVTSMDGDIADLLQRFQQSDMIALSEAAAEKSRQIETIEFGSSARYQIKANWSVTASRYNQRGIVIGHADRGVIGGKSNRPKSEQEDLLKIQNPKGRPIVIDRG